MCSIRILTSNFSSEIAILEFSLSEKVKRYRIFKMSKYHTNQSDKQSLSSVTLVFNLSVVT
jgi:hypothetical protein